MGGPQPLPLAAAACLATQADTARTRASTLVGSPQPRPIRDPATLTSGPVNNPRMMLADMACPEFETHLRCGRAIIPIGTLTSHGPHLPLGADTMISDYFAARLAADIDALIAPTISYGAPVAPPRIAGAAAGGIAVSASTFTHLVTDVVKCLLDHGVREAVLVNSAIDNLKSLGEAVRTVSAAYPETRIMIVSWWEALGGAFRTTLAPDAGVPRSEDHHAGILESSLLMHIASQATSQAPTRPPRPRCRLTSSHLVAVPDQVDAQPTTAGAVCQADAALGARLAEKIAREITTAVRREFGLATHWAENEGRHGQR